MASIIENLNSVITTKNQLNTILKENGQPGSEVFSEYPEQFRAAIAGAGTSEEAVNSYISSYLDTYNFIDADELSNCGYITSSDIPDVDLSSYVTYDYLSAQGYVTSVPAIDENIVPKETNTYTLGDGNNIYSNTYSRGVYLGTGVRMYSESSASSNDIAIALGGTAYYYMSNNRFAPNGAVNSEKIDLGTADRKWNHIYGKSVNVDTTYTSNLYTQSVNLNHTSRNGWIISSEGSGNELQLKPYNTQRTINVIDYYGNKMLRMYANSSSTNYAYSYCVTYFDKPVYFNNTTNLIWTGTSAEYAALSDYTTYQIYMIKEA